MVVWHFCSLSLHSVQVQVVIANVILTSAVAHTVIIVSRFSVKQQNVHRHSLSNNCTFYIELRDFISKQKRGEKGKITERPREMRERVQV